jgi:hypothetical protein
LRLLWEWMLFLKLLVSDSATSMDWFLVHEALLLQMVLGELDRGRGPSTGVGWPWSCDVISQMEDSHLEMQPLGSLGCSQPCPSPCALGQPAKLDPRWATGRWDGVNWQIEEKGVPAQWLAYQGQSLGDILKPSWLLQWGWRGVGCHL